jgi:hypothetical protein
MKCTNCGKEFEKGMVDLEELRVGGSLFGRREGPFIDPYPTESYEEIIEQLIKRTEQENIEFIQDMNDVDGEDIYDNLETETIPFFLITCYYCSYTMFAEELGLLPWREMEKGFDAVVNIEDKLGNIKLQIKVLPNEKLIAEYNNRKQKYVGYKICTTIKEELTSSHLVDPEHRVTYKEGIWSVPKPGNGPLVLYSSLDEATKNKHPSPSCSIHKCLYVPSTEDTVWIMKKDGKLENTVKGITANSIMLLKENNNGRV